jgi:hypothetical protein
MNDLKPLRGFELAAQGVYIYHNFYLFDHQTKHKITYHQNCRLRDLKVEIPMLLRILRGTYWAERWLQALWMSPRLEKVRKRRERDFHHDYFEKIWKAWDKDLEGIELRCGISPGPGFFRFTKKFEIKHPENINHRFPEARS